MSTKGTLDIAGVRAHKLIREIAAALTRARADVVAGDDDSVSFRAGLFRLVLSTNPLVGIEEGTVRVTSTEAGCRVEYELSFRQVVVMSVIMAGAMALFMARTAGVASIGLGVLFFSFFAGGNFALGLLQFRLLVRSAAQQLRRR